MTFDYKSADIINAMIALATGVGTIIAILSYQHHVNERKKQEAVDRNSRMWELRKEPLIKLLTAISDALKVAKYNHDYFLQEEHDVPCDDKEPDIKDAFTKLETELRFLDDVYGLLIPKDIIDAINEFKRQDQLIKEAYNQHAFTEFDASNAYLGELQVLHSIVSEYTMSLANMDASARSSFLQ